MRMRRLKGHRWLLLLVALALVAAACGDGTDAGDTTGAPTTTAGSDTTEPEGTTTSEGGEMTTTSDASADDFVAQAIAANEARTVPQTEWTGPTSGPAPVEGTSVVVVATDLNNATAAGVAEAVEEIGAQIGWEVTVIDGRGTADGQLTAVNQAIALQPDGIIGSGLDAPSYQEALCEAESQGIPFVGFHATGTPGQHPDACVFWSVSQDPVEIGHALADYVVADSNGGGSSTILYDANYAIAQLKADSMREQFEKCGTCDLLSFENSPLSEVTTRTPQTFTNWTQEYESPWYTMTIADFYYDFAVPALRDAGVPTDAVRLVGSDGTDAAYERIRAGEYQVATAPVPERLEAFIVVDQMIRALAGEDPVEYFPPVYIVTADNIDAEGGDENRFDPSNGYEERYYEIWGVSQ